MSIQIEIYDAIKRIAILVKYGGGGNKSDTIKLEATRGENIPRLHSLIIT